MTASEQQLAGVPEEVPMQITSRQAEDSSDEEEDEKTWLLGFVEPPLSEQSLLRHRFPSKLGGRPAWLDPVRLPSAEQLAGPDGKEPLSFLLQVYAPVELRADAFHRSLYLFMHPDASMMLKPNGVRVLRCQLPRRNPYYAASPAPESQLFPDRPREGPAHADPWGCAQYELSKGASDSRRPTPFLYPEAELVVEEEASDSFDPATQAQELQKLLKKTKLKQQEAGEDEEDDATMIEGIEEQISDEQRDFAAFSARIAPEPAQCLRYCFEPGTSPLWPSTKNTPQQTDIPHCPNCGGPRRFEFQIMPQLLTHMGIDDSRVDAPDYAMLAVYSCAASCSVNSDGPSAYLEEFVWVQPPLK